MRPPEALVDDDQVGPCLLCKRDNLGFAAVEIGKQVSAARILESPDRDARPVLDGTRPDALRPTRSKLRLHGGRDEDFAVKRVENVQKAQVR